MGSSTTAAKKKRMEKSFMESLKKARSWAELLLGHDYTGARGPWHGANVNIQQKRRGQPRPGLVPR